jgi:hypothetical protein
MNAWPVSGSRPRNQESPLGLRYNSRRSDIGASMLSAKHTHGTWGSGEARQARSNFKLRHYHQMMVLQLVSRAAGDAIIKVQWHAPRPCQHGLHGLGVERLAALVDVAPDRPQETPDLRIRGRGIHPFRWTNIDTLCPGHTLHLPQ